MSTVNAIDSITQEISIKAPAQRVFDALSQPDQRVRWWGVEGRFQATHMESDLREGGAWRMTGTGMGGSPFVVCGEYREVHRPRVLEFTWLPDWEGDAAPTIVRFDLDEKNGVTTVRLTHSGFATSAERERYQGWPWLMSLLQAYAESLDTSGSAVRS